MNIVIVSDFTNAADITGIDFIGAADVMDSFC